jgi:enoyl-CoA hydratase
MSRSIELRLEGPHGELRLNTEGGKPFTVDHEVLDRLEAALESVETAIREAGLRVLVVRSTSEKYFCVGANIRVLQEMTAATIGPWVERGHEVFNRLEDLGIPTIALVNGYAMGGGLELALSCDFIYATEGAKFSQSEAKLGFVPGWGGSRRLVERIGKVEAKHLFYTGELFDGARGKELGLVDHFGSAEELENAIAAFSTAVAGNSAVAISAYKTILREDEKAQRAANGRLEAETSIACLEDPDTLQRVEAFLNRKK